LWRTELVLPEGRWGWVPGSFDIGTIAGVVVAGLIVTFPLNNSVSSLLCALFAAFLAYMSGSDARNKDLELQSQFTTGVKLMFFPALLIAGVAAAAEISPGLTTDLGFPWWASVAAFAGGLGIVVAPFFTVWAEKHFTLWILGFVAIVSL